MIRNIIEWTNDFEFWKEEHNIVYICLYCSTFLLHDLKSWNQVWREEDSLCFKLGTLRWLLESWPCQCWSGNFRYPLIKYHSFGILPLPYLPIKKSQVTFHSYPSLPEDRKKTPKPVAYFSIFSAHSDNLLLGLENSDEKQANISGWWLTYPSEKYESHLGWLFPIYGNIKNISNHKPDLFTIRDPNFPLQRLRSLQFLQNKPTYHRFQLVIRMSLAHPP